jgi:hypothetical protein
MYCRQDFGRNGGMERFRACFGDLVDPRTGNAQRHDLLEMLLIALAATLSGGETCVDMALFGHAKEPLLRRFLRLEGGIPSHDTFSRLFRMLDPDAFEASFGRFVAAFAAEVGAAVAGNGGVVAVDAWCWVSARSTVTATRSPPCQSYWRCSLSTAGSSPPTPCTAKKRPPRSSSTVAATTFWR